MLASTMRSTLTSLCLVFALSGCVRRVVTADQLDAEEPPPGKVALNVVSDDGLRWEVRGGDDAPCTTPCGKVLAPTQGLTLASRDWVMEVPSLASVAPEARRAVIVAEGPSRAMKVNGIVFTTLGGMGVVTGITLTAVGCSTAQERGGLCTAGLITGGITLPLMIVSIWMVAASGPTAHILPVLTVQPPTGTGTPVSLAVTPAGIAGSF